MVLRTQENVVARIAMLLQTEVKYRFTNSVAQLNLVKYYLSYYQTYHKEDYEKAIKMVYVN